MNAYTRSTCECTLGDMHLDLAKAIRKHLSMNNLDDDESSHLICCEITSTRKKTGLFANGNETKIIGMLVTTQLLVWPIGRKGVNSLSPRHCYATLTRTISRTQPCTRSISRLRYKLHWPLHRCDQTGTDSAGENFRQVLQHAIQKAQS